MRSYAKFDESERQMIRKWQIGFAAFYSAIFLVLLAFVIADQRASTAATTTQAKISSAGGFNNR